MTKETVPGIGPPILPSFCERLPIRVVDDWEDEITIPFGLCQSDGLESAETLVEDEYIIITEQDIIG